jgi:hypothetical protein
MKQFIELPAAWISAIIQDVCVNVDFEVVSLPGGSLIAILFSLYAIALSSIRRAGAQNPASISTAESGRCSFKRLPPNGGCVGSACL